MVNDLKTTNLKNMVERKKGERNSLLKTRYALIEDAKRLNETALYIEEAKALINEVAQKTQAELQFHVSEIVSLGLSSIFPNPYKMEVEFVQKRGKTECNLFFSRDGHRIDPISGSGGGVVDIAAFALRVALWNLQRPQKRNVIILDEPFRFVSQNLRQEASKFLKEVSHKLGLQIIMVTHDPNLIECADAVFEVTQDNKGVSSIKKEDIV